VGGAGGRARAGRQGGQGAGSRGDARVPRCRRRTRAGDRPRRGRLRRRRPGRYRPAHGQLGALRAHVERRGRHRPVRDPHARRRRAREGQWRAGGRAAGAGPRAAAHAHGRAHPRHARRADDLRREAGPLVPPGGARPPAPPGGTRGRRRGQAVGGGGHLLQRRPPGRAPGVRRPRPAAGARHPGRRPRPPCRVSLGLRVGRGLHRGLRHRDPPPPAHRGGRGRGALPRRPEGQLGHAPQAQPRHLRTPGRAGPGAARQPGRRARGRGPVARA
jgi:hypothetical protein